MAKIKNEILSKADKEFEKEIDELFSTEEDEDEDIKYITSLIYKCNLREYKIRISKYKGTFKPCFRFLCNTKEKEKALFLILLLSKNELTYVVEGKSLTLFLMTKNSDYNSDYKEVAINLGNFDENKFLLLQKMALIANLTFNEKMDDILFLVRCVKDE